MALIFCLLITACAANAPPEAVVSPTPEMSAKPIETIEPTETPTPTQTETPTPTPEFPTEISDELRAFAELLAPNTVYTPGVKIVQREDAFADYLAGVPMSFDELVHLLDGIDYFNGWSVDFTMTAAVYDSLPENWYDIYDSETYNDIETYNIARKPVWIAMNGDGTDEAVLITRGGGGSEGGSVYIYTVGGGEYALKCAFYIGMSQRAYVTEYGGAIFPVIRTIGDAVDVSEDPVNFDGENTMRILPLYLLRRFDTDWSYECVIIANGEISVPEYNEFTGFHSGELSGKRELET